MGRQQLLLLLLQVLHPALGGCAVEVLCSRLRAGTLAGVAAMSSNETALAVLCCRHRLRVTAGYVGRR